MMPMSDGHEAMEELEIKFQLPPQAAGSLREALRQRGARTVRLEAHYFDTPEDLFAANGLVLRLRKEGRRWVQTLKGRQGNSAVQRLEHEVLLGAARADEMPPAPDLQRHAIALASHGAAEALIDGVGDQGVPLVERYGTLVRRTACRVELPQGASVEVALDIGEVVAGSRRLPICEIEIELKSGPSDALFALAAHWAGFAGTWLDVRPKSLRGLRLARGEERGPARKAERIQLEPGMTGGAILRVVLHSVLEQVLLNASEIADDGGEAELVHQLRVGLRRLRTALRELAPLSQNIPPHWDTTLGDAARALGALRDQEVLSQAIEPLLRKAGAPISPWHHDPPANDAAAIVKAPPLQRVLVEILGLASSPEASERDLAPAQAKVAIAQGLEQLHRRLRKGGRRFGDLSLEAQHRERKRVKRLRYLTEFAAGLWKAGEVQRYLERLEPLQDALGHHHDLTVAAEKFARDAETDARWLFAAGYLKGRLEWSTDRCQRRFRSVTRGSRFW